MTKNGKLCLKLIHCANINIATPGDTEQKNTFYMPMGLFPLANILKQQGVEVEIIHMDLEMGKLIEEILDFEPLDAVGFDLHWINQSRVVLDTAGLIKKIKPQTFIFLGGFSASLFGWKILSDYDQIDAVIRGDSEVPLVELCAILQDELKAYQLLNINSPRIQKVLPGVKNLVWRDNSGVIQSNPFSYVGTAAEMDRLDFGTVDLLRNWESYRMFSTFWTHFSPIDHSPLFFLEVGRGCSYACTYCGGNCQAQLQINNRKQVAVRSIHSIISTIKQAVTYGFETFYTCLEFEGSEEWYMRLFRGIVEENIHINFVYGAWRLPSKPMMEALSESFRHVIVEISPETGIEVLRKRNKDCRLFFTNKQLENLLGHVQAQSRRNINIQLYFGYYLVDDTELTILQSIRYILEILLKYPGILEVEYSNFSTDPGSLIFFSPQTYGFDIKVRSFNDYLHLIKRNYIEKKGQSADMTLFKPASISDEKDVEIHQYIRLFNNLFTYFRKSISHLLQETRNPTMIIDILKEAPIILSHDYQLYPSKLKETLLDRCDRYDVSSSYIIDLINTEYEAAVKKTLVVKAIPQIWLECKTGKKYEEIYFEDYIDYISHSLIPDEDIGIQYDLDELGKGESNG
jgi:radical SAM superfamily enzyme YgiQ (UPF0313 family)